MSENKLPPEIEKQFRIEFECGCDQLPRHFDPDTDINKIKQFIADKLAEEREKIASELANWFPVGANLTFTGGQLKSYIETYLTPQEVGMKGGEKNV